MFYYKYRKYAVYAGAFIALFFTAACSLQPVSSMRVKAKPSIYVPLGSEKITVSNIDEELGKMMAGNEGSPSETKARIFRYTPSGAAGEDKDQLRYLIHYPVQSFNFDISNYFGTNAVTSNTGLSYNVDESISIPSLEATQTCTMAEATTINDKLLEYFNNPDPATLPSKSIPAGMPTGYSLRIDISIAFEGFDELTFGGNSVAFLEFSAILPEGMTYSFSDTQLISGGNTFQGYHSSSNAVRFYIYDNKPIRKDIRITGTMELAGNVSQGGTVTFQRKLEGTIEEAKGVNARLENLTVGGSQSVALPLPDDFKKAVIKEGNLKFSIRQPAGWDGISIKEKTKIEQSGSNGLLIDPPEFRPLGSPISLAGLTLNDSKTLTYTPKLEVILTDATYRKPSESLSADFSFAIQKFAELTLKNRPDFAVSKSEAVPEEMKNWVKKIDFNKVSAKVKLYNGLPTENPIKLKLSSASLHIPPNVQTFDSQTTTEHTYESASNWTLDVENTTNLDLNVGVELPDYNETDKTFTLKNIAAGSNIKISIETSFDLDWNKITLKAHGGQQFSYPKEQDNFIDLSSFAKLKDIGIRLPDIPVYVYAGSASGLLKDQPIKIGLSTRYTEKDGATPQTMIICDEAPCELQSFPAEKFAGDTKEYTGDIPKASVAIKKGEPGVEHTLSELFNKYPMGVQLTYALTMGEITVDRAAYNDIINKGGKAEIKLDVLLDVPLSFDIEPQQRISLKPFMQAFGEGDLFNRKSANEKIIDIDNRLIDAVDTIQLNVNIQSDLGIQPGIIFQATDSNGKLLIEKKLLSAAGEPDKLSKEDWELLQNTYPVYSELFLEFPEGKRTIKLKKEFTLSASLSVYAGTQIDYPVDYAIMH
ncbi:hypothetical protein [Treponema vincentii]|uniref:hypothetical protein n=1 Tax=Treponema vincentii TaxID=69710 RepID=UPI003D930214